jgi:hypothetical protein
VWQHEESEIPARVSEESMENEHVSKPSAPGPAFGVRGTAPRDVPEDSKEYLAKLDAYELQPEVPLDPSKMKPNRFAGRVRPLRGPAESAGFTRGGARNGAGRKHKPQSERSVRKTVTLYQSEIRFLRTLDPNLSKAIRKLPESETR